MVGLWVEDAAFGGTAVDTEHIGDSDGAENVADITDVGAEYEDNIRGGGDEYISRTHDHFLLLLICIYI